MSWNPNLNDVYQPIPTKQMLREGINILVRARIVSFPKEQLKDSHGIFAYRYGHMIVCAKSYIYGNIISFHRQIVGSAIANKINILLYLGRYNNKRTNDEFPVFYEFNPEDILKDNQINHKGQAEMLNCKINLGKRFVI